MCAKVFLSGATGFLGTFIAEELISTTNAGLTVLVRAADEHTARTRLKALWYKHETLLAALRNRISIVVGDLTLPQLGLSNQGWDELAGSVTHIIHAAADTSLLKTKEQLSSINVTGTQSMLALAHAAASEQGLERFSHVSTTYVAGLRTGFIEENSLIDEGFASNYEWSKFEAEKLVRACKDEFSLSVFRPAQIVGNSETGEIFHFNTLYYPLKLYLKGKLRVLPLSGNQRMNLVPVDFVARAVVKGTLDSDAAGKTFHLTAPKTLQPTASELISAVQLWAKTTLNIELPKPFFLPFSPVRTWASKRNLSLREGAHKKSVTNNMLALAPYFYENREFDTRNTETLMGSHPLSWQDFLPALLDYSVQAGFLDHSERTVFEQMRVRQKSERFPLRYYDVSSKGMVAADTGEVVQRIEGAAAALSTLGIGSGCRVAVVGTNSINYLIVDAAIGLVGAVSVPLYYTAPLDELEDLVKRSKAQALFIGTQQILDTWRYAVESPRIVSMLSNAASSPGQALPWEEFLAMGAGDRETSPSAPPSYGDLATIRYTSGTTGDPKGVLFTHRQLRWMGETLPSLLDWKSRNSTIRYLSFLPMSHVVEGILVAYAPYYILSDVEIYYLSEFNYLTEALPKIRPTIFFSVPRFYEKAWEQLLATGAGRFYAGLKSGALKRLVGRVCKRALLKKAGLDACRQLIVGSAPISVELLEAYRQLGIEIYNAFGLTEAPLITLSRYGDNELGSVGALLPESEATIDESGEVLIRGPQVTVGYDGEEPLDEADGYLKTGDFGHFSPRGFLTLDGRKKELLITSYAKNVSPQKIETRLKAIPLITEALVVGDALPYCAALIWVETDGGALSTENRERLDAAVGGVNATLSHPEQLKKWVYITRSLSIQQRELTPNLKLRRDRVQDHYQAALAALYDGVANEFTANLRIAKDLATPPAQSLPGE